LPSLAQEYAGLDISQMDVSQISESSAIIILNKVFGTLLTAQGFEFDYVGVIFGNDLVYDLDEQRIVSAK